MRIAVDAMGSDNHPQPDVEGAVLAARELGDEIILVGDQRQIEHELGKRDLSGLNITVQHASQVVSMIDQPRDVVRGKPNSSIHVGMALVKKGDADAFVTAGNTGGVLAIAMLGDLRRIPGIKRPGLGVRFPIQNYPLLIDGGVNADCTPRQLVQFAHMGSIYVSLMNGIQQPRVALISNGEEESKGNKLIRETSPLLQDSDLHYVGQLEPKEFMSGEADVAVADGFVGNIMLKTAEATAKYLVKAMRTEIRADVLATIGAWLARSAFKRVSLALEPDEIGGAPLLGVNGVVIIAHGRSNSYAMKQAIRQARCIVQAGVLEAIRQGVANLG